MTDNRISSIVEQQIDNATGLNMPAEPIGMSDAFSWLVQTSDIVPPWWSRARDRRLSQIWKESNHLALAIYNTQAKIVGIPPAIVALDTSNDVHMEQAADIEYTLLVASGLGEGWSSTYSKFIEDIIVRDNGGFMEVLGDGPADGPIIGRSLGVRHLDSLRCQRTGHPIYPVLYTAEDGRLYKIHWTRIIYMSQMPSSLKDMHGVGLSGVSRCVEIATTLADMVRYKQERLGSRPHNQLLVGKGVTGKTIMTALMRAEGQLSAKGFRRYASTVAIGSENPAIEIERVDLTHMEPFQEETSTNLGMFAIAAALGMDADEIWPASGRSGGGSAGDANLRRMRSRGRLPAQLTAEIAAQFNFKVLPPHLRMQFDFHDDEEDQQRAVIRDIRGRNRSRDLESGAINIRSARKRMLVDKDVDHYTFEDMELVDGRLPNGSPVGVLFFDNDPVYARHLRFLPNPLSFIANIVGDDEQVDTSKTNEVLASIQGQRETVLSEWASTGSGRKAEKIKRAYHALDWLEQQYLFAAGRLLPEVPMVSRRARTDIRVIPAEDSPETGQPGTSPAEQASGGGAQTENMTANG